MLALLTATVAATDHWAVLVAGSSGYGNYRHQADVCHAYQVVRSKGIPAENIIVMAVDDIANDGSNPYPGKLFNKPTPAGTPGVDVYAGCQIDWAGSRVTPDNFIKVLTGDNSSSLEDSNGKCSAKQTTACTQEKESCCCTNSFFFKCTHSVCCPDGQVCHGTEGCAPPSPPPPPPKVLRSTSSSKVFINFVDHGGVGLIGFPSSTMHAQELATALATMHQKGMYQELVFYLEACESGSMFPAGSLQPGMFATTAANAMESSWGTYCSPQDNVDGKNIGSCLGDLYSVNWMEDSDSDKPAETLEQQFERVKTLTNKSHVLQFGDNQTIGSEPITNFQGDGAVARSHRAVVPALPARAQSSVVDSRDAELQSAFARFLATDSAVPGEELVALVRDRAAAAARFTAISRAVAGIDVAHGVLPTMSAAHYDCHYAAHRAYVRACGEWTSMSLKHSATLAKLCDLTHNDAVPITAAIRSECKRE